LNDDGSVKTVGVKAAAALTLVVGTADRLSTLQGQKGKIDAVVSTLPTTWAKTGAVTDGAPALYNTLAALKAAGTASKVDMAVAVKLVVDKAKL
jgi:hypothetical protein